MPTIAGSADPMTPVSAGERIGLIDILRGLALFGIIAANMRGFSAPAQVYFNIGEMFSGAADTFAQAFIDFFIQGKFITLFAFLFGLGFAIQMSRAEERGKPTRFYLRRLLVLFGFGLIHAWFIWWGDILAGYALTGFVLFLFRKPSRNVIAISALTMFMLPVLLQTGATVYSQWRPDKPVTEAEKTKQKLERQKKIEKSIRSYRDGSVFEQVKQRFNDWKELNNAVPAMIFAYVLPRFLMGVWVWRTGIVRNLEPYLPLIRRTMWISLALGFSLNVAGIAADRLAAGPKEHPWLGLASFFSEWFAAPAIACFYACTVTLAVQNPVWKNRLEPFGAVGRMALTNYLTQSIVCTWFFHLTKLFGSVGPAWDLLPTVVVYGLQVPFSVWWLRRYNFGPAEWLWRALTYGYKPAMHRLTGPDAPYRGAVEA